MMEKQVLSLIEKQDAVIDEAKARVRAEEAQRKVFRCDLERIRAELEMGDVVPVT